MPFCLLVSLGELTVQYNETERRREMAKNSLEKYTHYYERWAANEQVHNLSYTTHICVASGCA